MNKDYNGGYRSAKQPAPEVPPVPNLDKIKQLEEDNVRHMKQANETIDICEKALVKLHEIIYNTKPKIPKTTRIIPLSILPFKGGCEECGKTVLNRDYNFCPWCGREIAENEIVATLPPDLFSENGFEKQNK